MVTTLHSRLRADHKVQFSQFFEELGKVLDITKTQYDAAIRSYEFVANWLAENYTELSIYKPEIWPQGSFLLGTMIQPFGKEELDLDLVCRLIGKPLTWTQYHLKQAVGDRLKAHGTLKKLLVTPDGRRCWTLDYCDEANFHMDVLAAIVSHDYKEILEQALSNSYISDYEKLGIRITDKTLSNYMTETNQLNWLLCNPFGYAVWFHDRANVDSIKAFTARDSVKPVPAYQKNKLPLQRIVQLLKRHRDIMFNGDDKKPISIILTTLAAKAYRKETSVADAMINIVERMSSEIEERYSAKHGRIIKWIPNPVNPAENFADKWAEDSVKQENFYRWLNKLHTDLQEMVGQTGLSNIRAAMSKPFGEKEVTKAFGNFGDNLRTNRDAGNLSIATSGIVIGKEGLNLGSHIFDGI